jgi:hypothetical protein
MTNQPKLQKIDEKQIQTLSKLLTKMNIIIACDEEWNTLFDKWEINIDADSGRPVIFGLSGSEIEQNYD